MFLNALADIQSAVTLVNSAINNGTAEISPETFYSKQLLDTIRIDGAQYVYFRLADTAPIQEKADKLMLRRWAPLQGHTVPLSEGVPPQSDKGSVEKYELEAFQYGRYMEFTDKVSMKVVDPILAHYSKEYSLVAMETLDLLAKEALLLAAQKFYPFNATSPDGLATITAAQRAPAMNDLRKIQLSLKKQLVKPRTNGKYHVIGSPEFYFDMLSDPLVEKFMEINQTTKPMYDGGVAPLPPMFGFEFYETLVVPTSGEWVDSAGDKRLKLIATADGAVTQSAVGVQQDLSENNAPEYDLVDGYVNDSRTGQPGSYIPQRPVWTIPVGFREFKMQHILILGDGALTRTGLAGEDNVKMITKPLGSTGVLDPIDQRQSIGFKINSVGFGSTRPEAIVDYVCVPTQVNL
jgi:hypothetical protein